VQLVQAAQFAEPQLAMGLGSLYTALNIQIAHTMDGRLATLARISYRPDAHFLDEINPPLVITLNAEFPSQVM